MILTKRQIPRSHCTVDGVYVSHFPPIHEKKKNLTPPKSSNPHPAPSGSTAPAPNTTCYTNTSSPTPKTSSWAKSRPKHRKSPPSPFPPKPPTLTTPSYFAPQPNALVPFPPISSLCDPNFATSCAGIPGNCAAAWGLRVINSKNILVYGAGLYSFFSNYSTSCSTFEAGQMCQSRMVSVEGGGVRNVNIYNLNTIGVREMITRDGRGLAGFGDNVNVFPSCVGVWRSE